MLLKSSLVYSFFIPKELSTGKPFSVLIPPPYLFQHCSWLMWKCPGRTAPTQNPSHSDSNPGSQRFCLVSSFFLLALAWAFPLFFLLQFWCFISAFSLLCVFCTSSSCFRSPANVYAMFPFVWEKEALSTSMKTHDYTLQKHTDHLPCPLRWIQTFPFAWY